MPRRSPGQVRRDPPYPGSLRVEHKGGRQATSGLNPNGLDRPAPHLPGLSPRGVAAIARLERTRLWPVSAREALEAWELFLRDPYHRLFDPADGCGVLMCCPDPAELRGLLHAIAHALPRRDARGFRRRLAELDDRW